LKKEYVYGGKGLLATIEPSTGTRYTTADHLGSPRVVTNSSAGVVSRHDYMPFGEELGSGVGGRTTGMGFSVGDGVRQKFTSKERDIEIGFDYFNARYYASVQGRFSSADDFSRDSDLADAQSWNKYSFVRNNPLRFFDPTGAVAEVVIDTDEKKKKGTITVNATIALWTRKGESVTQNQMDAAKTAIENRIKDAYAGTFEKNGITYSVSVSVTASVYSSEQEAINSGSMNVIRVSEGDASPIGSSIVDRSDWRKAYDTATWSIQDILRTDVETPAHEFVHLLGVQNQDASNHLSTGFEERRASRATSEDYHWIFDRAIDRHRNLSRFPNPVPIGIMNRAPAGNGLGPPTSYRSKHRLRA